MYKVYDDYSNEDLIYRLKKNEEGAFTYLVDKYHHKLCVYANSLINDTALSEDIVQNVFIKIWERRHKLKSNFSIKSLLYKSVFNEFVDYYRKSQSVTALERKYIEGIDLIVEEKNEDSLEKLIELVKEAIHELPPKCKLVFLLSKKEGLTNAEISEYLNLSKKTIERQMTKAFSKIRKNVGARTDVLLFLLFRTN